MIRGIYTAASGMLAEQKRLDVIANNLANVSTTGYKRDAVTTRSFAEIFVSRIHDNNLSGLNTPAPVGPLGLGTYVERTATRLTTGALRATGNPLDVAIVGDGFFAVQTPQGIRYTRQGNFVQDSAGVLVTPEGYPVLVDGGIVMAQEGPLSINDHGEVFTGTTLLGQLTVVTSQELGALRKEGNGLWVEAGAGEQTMLVTPENASGRYQLRPGYLEASNVDAVIEMVEMISTMRTYEASQRSIHVQDETLQKAVNEVGRIG